MLGYIRCSKVTEEENIYWIVEDLKIGNGRHADHILLLICPHRNSNLKSNLLKDKHQWNLTKLRLIATSSNH